MTRTLFIAVALAATAAALPGTAAAETTRPEYTTRVEPICQRNTEANKRIFAGAKEQVKAGQLKAASSHFKRAVTAFEKTIAQLRAVPEPAADEARLAKWLGYLGAESTYLGKIAVALSHEDKASAQTLSVRLNRNSNLANNTVLAFGFDYCKIDPARFG